ncbi:hypothetical protein ZOSMA_51G00480 [Zostera marina]|uniref:Uncharacterized protein n=1 Tax=Zostera marina TaxID=29655 RepID=A0A0K9NXY3_ZOSMR|nr:hypothetical protein ZOSMA_51G00480 [Zostera marina]
MVQLLGKLKRFFGNYQVLQLSLSSNRKFDVYEKLFSL